MSRFFCVVFLLAVTALHGAPALAAEPMPSPGKQVEIKAVAGADDNPPYNYLLFTPASYAKQGKWPLIVFLHGSGERGDDLKLVKKHGPPKIVEEKPDFEFIVVSPQVPADSRWDAEKVGQIIDQVSKSLKVDADRIYLTGLSMGGSGTWKTAAEYPNRFAAIVPICGRGDPDTAETIKSIPCWVFHGAKDEAVPLARSEEMVAAIKKAGGQPKFTVYPDAEHDSWTESYNNPELYKWLLAQQRKK
jgi:predicted peptidase